MNIMVEAIGFIDDDLVESAFDYTLPKRNYGKYIAVAAAFVIAFAAAFAGIRYITKDSGEGPVNHYTHYFGGGDNFTEEIGDKIKFEGEIITDDEIRAYVEEHKYDRIGAIAAEYGDFESEYQIFVKGYRHVNLGTQNVLKLDFIDLPIVQNGRIIAMMTLFRGDDGELRSQLAAGGPTWEERMEIFEENPDDELAFFYYGFRELVITPSNRIYCIGSMSEKKLDLDRDIDYYNKFRTEYNSFSLDDLKNSENYITVVPVPEERITGYTPEQTEAETESEQFEIPTIANTSSANITLEDVLVKEIVSVEWGNSYNLLMNKPLKKTTAEQAEKIVDAISGMELVKAEKVIFVAGGGWLARLNYTDGTYAIVCVRGENQVVFETSEGTSVVYDDLSGNATVFESYLISLVE